MSRFMPLDGSVLLRQNGAFSEHQTYHNDERELFARKGNSYLRLLDHGATSVSKVFWGDMELKGLTYTIKRGRLVLTDTSVIRADRRRSAV